MFNKEKIEKEYNPYLISKIQPQGGIQFEEDFIKKGDGYETCIHIYDYPSNVDDFWLKNLFDKQDTIVTLDVGYSNKNKLFSSLDKSLQEQETRFYDSRNRVSKIEAQTTYNQLNELTEEITNDGEILNLINIRFYLFDRTKAGLEKKIKSFLEDLPRGFKGAIYLNETEIEWRNLFQSFTLTSNEITKRSGKAVTSSCIGAGYPFNFTYLDDYNGIYLGRTNNGGNVLWNLFYKDEARRYYNAVILGQMGSGKSTLLKKIFKDYYALGHKIRVLDVTGEFKTLTEYLGGTVISLDGTNGIINPLQIYATMTIGESTEVDYEGCFVSHITKVKNMYNLVNGGNTSEEELKEFTKILREFYIDYGITQDKCTTFSSEEYPIFSELSDYIKEILWQDEKNGIVNNNITEVRSKRLQNIILTIDEMVNTYGRLFNSHSTMQGFDNERIVCFDIKNLQQFGENIFNAQMNSALDMIWNSALTSGIKEKNAYENKEKSIDEIEGYIILADEFHRYTNASNIPLVDKFTQFEREGRKYFAGLLFATQSIRDVVPAGDNDIIKDKIRTLFELTQYKFIMQQDSNSKEALREIFEGQLSESEIQEIPKLSQGNSILSINGVKNILMHIYASDEEINLFKGGA